MGWFSSLFKKEKELQKAYIDISELQQWFNSKSEILIESIRESIKEDMDRINELIAQAKDSSKALEEAKLRNDKIPERAVQIMDGNRKSYINAVNNFVSNIQAPSAINFGTVSEFVSSFEDNLSLFTKTSARNYHILQEFFAHESGNIAKNIREMDVVVRSLLDNDYKKINSIHSSISKLNELLKKKETAEIMLSEHEKEKAELTSQIDSANEGISSLKGSRDYRFLKEAEGKRNEITAQMKGIEKSISELFSPLEKPMKKFAKIASDREDIIGEYLESPLNAAINDKGFKITEVVEKMKASIENGEIELKDKAKEKALAQIGLINGIALKNFTEGYGSLKELHSENEKSLKMSTALQKQNELEYKLSHLKDKLAAAEKNTEKLKKFLEMPEMEEIIQGISNDVMDVLNTELRIKIGNKVIGKRQEAKVVENL